MGETRRTAGNHQVVDSHGDQASQRNAVRTVGHLVQASLGPVKIDGVIAHRDDVPVFLAGDPCAAIVLGKHVVAKDSPRLSHADPRGGLPRSTR